MECGIGLCGHCQMGRYFVCRTAPSSRAPSWASLRRGGHLMAPADPSDRSRSASSSSPRATAASWPCWASGRCCSSSAQRFEIVEFGEASSNRSAGPVRRAAGRRVRSAPPSTSSTIRELRARTTLLVDHRCVRHERRHPGAARLGAGDGVAASVYPRPEEIASLATATPVADHVHGRRRAARLPHRSAASWWSC